jgi:hypothetical protein
VVTYPKLSQDVLLLLFCNKQQGTATDQNMKLLRDFYQFEHTYTKGIVPLCRWKWMEGDISSDGQGVDSAIDYIAANTAALFHAEKGDLQEIPFDHVQADEKEEKAPQ